jgi:hypothetical protein
MINEKGAVLRLVAENTGVSLSLGDGPMTLSLEK